MFEFGEDIAIIDQHAAHERLLYNKFINLRRMGEKEIQTLLVPYTLKVNSMEYEFISTNLNYLKELGFEISPLPDGNFSVSTVPNEFVELEFDEFFDDVLSDYHLRYEHVPEIINDKLIQKACKAAIKAGQKLSDSEVKSLLRLLDGNIHLKCPHGRPIAVVITRNEIDKWFKRVL